MGQRIDFLSLYSGNERTAQRTKADCQLEPTMRAGSHLCRPQLSCKCSLDLIAETVNEAKDGHVCSKHRHDEEWPDGIHDLRAEVVDK
jgi:hypothetical protein